LTCCSSDLESLFQAGLLHLCLETLLQRPSGRAAFPAATSSPLQESKISPLHNITAPPAPPRALGTPGMLGRGLLCPSCASRALEPGLVWCSHRPCYAAPPTVPLLSHELSLSWQPASGRSACTSYHRAGEPCGTLGPTSPALCSDGPPFPSLKQSRFFPGKCMSEKKAGI